MYLQKSLLFTSSVFPHCFLFASLALSLVALTPHDQIKADNGKATADFYTNKFTFTISVTAPDVGRGDEEERKRAKEAAQHKHRL